MWPHFHLVFRAQPVVLDSMTENEELLDEVMAILRSVAPDAKGIERTTPLFDVFDSIQIVTILDVVNEKFGIDFMRSRASLEVLQTPEGIVESILKARSAVLAFDRDSLRSHVGSEQQVAAQSARQIAELRRQIEVEHSPSRLDAGRRSDAHPTQDVAGLQHGTEVQQAGQPAEPAAKPRPAEPLDADELRVVALNPSVKAALDAYHAAHGDREQPSPEALLRYFATPQQGADFFEFLETLKHVGEKQGSQTR